jgi:hypothetical protein
MLFIAKTILMYANKESTKDGTIDLTRGEVIPEIINADYAICLKDKTQAYFAVKATKFSRFFYKFWFKYYDLYFGLMPFR